MRRKQVASGSKLFNWFAAALVVLVTGCSTPTPSQPAPGRATAGVVQSTPPSTQAGAVTAVAPAKPLVFAVSQEPVTLDPHVNDFSYSLFAQRGAYEPLVDYEVGQDGKVQLVPQLAAKWDVTPDSRIFTFTLRPNIKFSDGTALDGDAVKYNLDRVQALQGAVAGRLPGIEKVEVVDPTSVRVTLKTPYAPFVDVMTRPFMVSPTAARSHEVDGDWGQKWLSENMVGTGPYLLQSWERGQRLTLAKNPAYWKGWDGRHLDNIILQVVKEPSTQKLMIEKGDAQLADTIALTDLDSLSKAEGVVVDEHNAPQLLHVWLRNRGVLKDQRVRQAISYAFDYDGFISSILQGRAAQPTGPLQLGQWAHDDSLTPYHRDLDKAKQLLADAGHPGGGFDLTIGVISTFGDWQLPLGQLVQSNLADIGINLKVQNFSEGSTFSQALSTIDSGPDMSTWAVGLPIDDPSDLLTRQYHTDYWPPKAWNFSWYSNPEVDKLLDQAAALPEREQRIPLYKQVQRLVNDDAPGLWVAQLKAYAVYRSTLKGYVWNQFLGLQVPTYYGLYLEGG